MSIRHLDRLFSPASVAVLGATERPGSVGDTVWRNLRDAYRGRLYPVNPKHRQIGGVAAFRSVQALPEAPDLAVVCTPAHTVAALIAALGARGTRAAVVLSTGLNKAQKQAMLQAAQAHTLRIVGPNCMGVLVPHGGLNASFAPMGAQSGDLAFVSQSGSLVTAMLDWAGARGIGFSHFVSLGESADVDVGDMLDFLGSDPKTRAILLYMESMHDAAKFMSAARAAARNKPVIVVKSGRSAAGQRAAASHTGALAGSDAVFDAAFARAGMLRVDTLHELFLAAETLSRFRDGPSGPLVVLSNSGAACVMAADAAAAADLPLAVLDAASENHRFQQNQPQQAPFLPDSQAHSPAMGEKDAEKWIAAVGLQPALPKSAGPALPAHGWRAQWAKALHSMHPAHPAKPAGPDNPVDLGGDAPVAHWVAALQALLQHSDSPVLLIHAPTAHVASAELAQALLPLLAAHPRRVLGCWLGDATVAQARHSFRQAGVPDFNTPEEAVRAFSLLRTHRLHQVALLQTPPTHSAAQPLDLPRLRATVDTALSQGREWLTEPEAQALLAAAGVPVVPTHTVSTDPAQAVAAANALGYPVVLKILSHAIHHKSEVGGVRLNIGSADELREVCTAMLARVRGLRPDADIQGFTVQPMVRPLHSHEVMVGTRTDPLLGPVLVFGAGGTAAAVLADSAIALPPLNTPLALAHIQRTRIARLLPAHHNAPAANVDAIAQVLVTVSQLLAELPELAELDINPLLARPEGVLALDARVRLSATRPAGAAHWVIQPYPQHLVQSTAWRGGTLTLRPIRPEDEAQHRRFLEQLDPQDIRMRVFYSRRSIEHSELARLTQIDYAREMAFIATQPRPDGGEDTLGAVRVTVDPDNDSAEFGLIVRSDLKGQGLGRRLMRKMIEYLQARGTQHMVGTVLRINTGMLGLAQALGFQEASHASHDPNNADDLQTCCVTLNLQAPASHQSHSG